MDRNEYLKYRQEDNQAAILTAYFVERTEQPGITTENFIELMFQAIEDDRNLQERIDKMYPEILQYYDKFFSLCFLIKDYGPGNRILITMY